MRVLIRLGGLLALSLALIAPSFAEDQKPGDKTKGEDDVEKQADKDKKEKKGVKKGKDDEPKEKFTYNQRYFLDGKLTQMDAASQRDFTLQVKVPEPNPDGIRHLQNLQKQLIQQQQQFFRTRPQDRGGIAQQIQNTQAEILKAQGNLVRFKDQDVKLRAAENMKVRWNFPPPDYDDKGNLKKYTKEELKALKDPGLPGYRGEFDALRTGQIVRVYLAKQHAYMKGAAK